jgi:hypothetical protein
VVTVLLSGKYVPDLTNGEGLELKTLTGLNELSGSAGFGIARI